MEDEKKYGDVILPDEEFSADDILPDSDFDVEGVEALESDPHTEDMKLPAESDVLEDSLSTDAHPINVEHLKQIDGRIERIAETEQRLFFEVREMHKLYHTEFAGRLKAMQDELEQYRKIDKGRLYDDILASIARIYCNNETLVEEVSEPKAKKSIRYMLMDIEDLLNVYGMTKLRSGQGEKRNPRHCQVLNRIPTETSAKHDTVAKSYNSGFYIGNRTVIKEVVDIYIFEGQTLVKETEEERKIEAGDTPVVE